MKNSSLVLPAFASPFSLLDPMARAVTTTDGIILGTGNMVLAGSNSIASGYGNNSTVNSIAIGDQNSANRYSIALGESSTASRASLSCGAYNTIDGNSGYSLAAGEWNYSGTSYATVLLGFSNSAAMQYGSAAIGIANTMSVPLTSPGGANILIGVGNLIDALAPSASSDLSYTGWASTAIGGGTNAIAQNSTAIGTGTRSATIASTAIGSGNIGITTPGYNAWEWNEIDPVLELGNSADANNRSNAITTLKNGQSTFTNKFWNSAQPTATPTNATEASSGRAIVVEGHALFKGNTVLEGKVTLAQPQGDISMGIYGN